MVVRPTPSVLLSPVFALCALAACNSSLVAYDVAKPPEQEATTDATTSGDDDDDSTSTPVIDSGTAPVERASVDGLDPAYGTVGSVVTIEGGPFVEPVEVTFDGVDAAVTNVREGAIEVEVPDLGDDVSAVVEVHTAAGKAAGSPSFEYFVDGTGKIGVFGTVEWNDLRGTYWDAASVDAGDAQIMFPVPTDTTWPELLYSPLIDHCELNYVPAQTTYIYDPGASSIQISAGATVHTLPSDADYPYIYFQSGLTIATGSAYDLEPISGGADWPSFSLADLTGDIPSALVLTTPDIDGATPPRVARQIDLGWSGPYDGDGMMLYLERQRYDSTLAVWVNQGDSVTCWVTDDGSFTVPSLWTDWQTNDGVLMYFGRYREPQNVILPFNNARSAVVGAYWLVGYLYAN